MPVIMGWCHYRVVVGQIGDTLETQPHGTVCYQHYGHWTSLRAPSSGHWRRTCSRPPSTIETFSWFMVCVKIVCVCVCVCQVCLLLLSCRSVIESGNMFIRVAMTLDVVCQYDIKDMMMGLLEPDHLITDADLTSLLTTARGRTWCLIALLRVWHRLGIDLVINRTCDQWLNLAGTSLQRL